MDGYYYRPRVDMEVLETYHEGIIALSACLAGEVQRYLTRGMYEEAKAIALKYETCFGKGNFFLELQDHGIPEQAQVNQQLLRMHQELGIDLVATNDVHYTYEKMRRHMTFCFVCRPAKSFRMKIVCAMRAVSIL